MTMETQTLVMVAVAVVQWSLDTFVQELHQFAPQLVAMVFKLLMSSAMIITQGQEMDVLRLAKSSQDITVQAINLLLV